MLFGGEASCWCVRMAEGGWGLNRESVRILLGRSRGRGEENPHHLGWPMVVEEEDGGWRMRRVGRYGGTAYGIQDSTVRWMEEGTCDLTVERLLRPIPCPTETHTGVTSSLRLKPSRSRSREARLSLRLQGGGDGW